MKTCRVSGCDNQAGVPGSARGLCRAHYRRWQRYGNELEPNRRVRSYEGVRCVEKGCSQRAMYGRRCEAHYAAKWRRDNPERLSRAMTAYKERFRASQEKTMGRARPLRCELCDELGYIHRSTAATNGICYDHDHASGAPRGWLCDRCNKVLGLARDNPDLLHKMAEYVERGGPSLNFPTFDVPVDQWRSLFREGNA